MSLTRAPGRQQTSLRGGSARHIRPSWWAREVFASCPKCRPASTHCHPSNWHSVHAALAHVRWSMRLHTEMAKTGFKGDRTDRGGQVQGCQASVLTGPVLHTTSHFYTPICLFLSLFLPGSFPWTFLLHLRILTNSHSSGPAFRIFTHSIPASPVIILSAAKPRLVFPE